MEDSSTSFSTYSPQKRKKRFFFLLLFIFLVLILWFVWSSLIGSKTKSNPDVTVGTPTPTDYVFPTDVPAVSPTLGPTSTPTPQPTTSPVDKATGLDRSELSVEVQNGSGVVGAASKGSETLKTFGYHVVSIQNADNFDYQDITILVKPDKKSYLSLLKKDLETVYTVGSSSATLSNSSSDAVVIIGE